MTSGDTMKAVRVHGPRDMRVDTVARPTSPGPGQALLRVLATGICGSDLHSYLDARIGDTPMEGPLVLGHEFSAIVEAVGEGGTDGNFEPLKPGARVAVDPAQPCGQCEMCEHGHPNLCWRLHFCGNYPHGGSLCDWMLMPARCCFPVPENLTDAQAALLEPLGVALHAVDLAKARLGQSAAVIGAGPIGLLILRCLLLAGASPVFVTDKLEWRLQMAEQFGGKAIHIEKESPERRIRKETGGRGLDIVVEAAWGDESVAQAAELARLGGRVVLVGIPSDDNLRMKHSTARRKGLTIMMSRRMKHVYPRAIALATAGAVDLEMLVSHRFDLSQTPAAFKLNTEYADRVVKIVVEAGKGFGQM